MFLSETEEILADSWQKGREARHCSPPLSVYVVKFPNHNNLGKPYFIQDSRKWISLSHPGPSFYHKGNWEREC
jgi:hypothetical protein